MNSTVLGRRGSVRQRLRHDHDDAAEHHGDTVVQCLHCTAVFYTSIGHEGTRPFSGWNILHQECQICGGVVCAGCFVRAQKRFEGQPNVSGEDYKPDLVCHRCSVVIHESLATFAPANEVVSRWDIDKFDTVYMGVCVDLVSNIAGDRKTLVQTWRDIPLEFIAAGSNFSAAT